MSYAIKKDTAAPLLFLMIASSDHISPILGLSPSVTISKNGGTFAAPAGAVTEIGFGWYMVAADAANADTLGPILLHATGAGADPTDVVYNVTDALVNLGPIQTTTIIGNIQGAVASVTNPVKCESTVTKRCCRCGC